MRTKLQRRAAQMNDRRFIAIEDDFDNLDGYVVVFLEKGGRSILSRQKTPEATKRRAEYFEAELKAGRLLCEDASVWQ